MTNPAIPENGPLASRLRRAALLLLSPVMQRWFHRHYRVARTWRWRELSIVIQPGVFPPGPSLSTRLLLDHLATRALAGVRLLELGCGTGAIATMAASRGALATASDINPDAVANAAANALGNGVTVEAVRSDLFDALDPLGFELIVINPPYYPREAADMGERAWYCGADFDYFRKLFRQLPAALPETLMILSQDCAITTIRALAAERGFALELVTAWRRWLEWNYLFRIVRAAQNPS